MYSGLAEGTPFNYLIGNPLEHSWADGISWRTAKVVGLHTSLGFTTCAKSWSAVDDWRHLQQSAECKKYSGVVGSVRVAVVFIQRLHTDRRTLDEADQDGVCIVGCYCYSSISSNSCLAWLYHRADSSRETQGYDDGILHGKIFLRFQRS